MPKLTTRILRGSPANLNRLAAALRRGELVAVPTETVYGLAGDALNPAAADAIFAAKGRPANDPLIVHIHDRRQLTELAVVNEAALKLARAFWPGPLTLVLPKLPSVPDRVTSGQASVAVRLPSHPLFRRLLRASGIPLAAPSANPFGYLSPTTAEHVRAGLGGRIRHILDGGPCVFGLESTIVDLRDPKNPALLRPGALAREAIEAVLGRKLRVRAKPAGGPRAKVVAPGQLTRHYSPRTSLALHAALPSAAAIAQRPDEVFVFLAKPAGPRPANVRWLDPRGNLRGVARRLFAELRALDDGAWKKIHVELARGDDGWAPAINDRLHRAAAKR
ncbi:MAG TPA: L-threonylcarbamoyladenylate synthase [Opitutaceae bacterium]